MMEMTYDYGAEVSRPTVREPAGSRTTLECRRCRRPLLDLRNRSAPGSHFYAATCPHCGGRSAAVEIPGGALVHPDESLVIVGYADEGDFTLYELGKR